MVTLSGSQLDCSEGDTRCGRSEQTITLGYDLALLIFSDSSLGQDTLVCLHEEHVESVFIARVVAGWSLCHFHADLFLLHPLIVIT